MNICLIWAQDKFGAIGKQQKLPWNIPEDLRRFKELTKGCPVIMGSKTFKSLPNGTLPGRMNIVLTRTPRELQAPGAVTVPSLDAAFQVAKEQAARKVYVIGGGEVYAEALRHADALEVTVVETLIEGADAHAPAVPGTFRLTEETPWLPSTAGLRYKTYSFAKWTC